MENDMLKVGIRYGSDAMFSAETKAKLPDLAERVKVYAARGGLTD